MDVHDNILEEYEKVFGYLKHENLFSQDDEEYKSLRQDILDSDTKYYDKGKLPFTGVNLPTFQEYLRTEIAQKATGEGHRIFYIRKYKGKNMVCYAAGYYINRNSHFIVLEESFFMDSDYYRSLLEASDPFTKAAFYKKTRSEGKTLFLRERWNFNSASLAASYILGKKSSFKEWKDKRGRTLDSYYSRFKFDNVEERENMTFPDSVKPDHIQEQESADPSTTAKSLLSEILDMFKL